MEPLESVPIEQETSPSAFNNERERILKVYAERDEGDYAFSDLWSLRIAHQRQTALAHKLRRHGLRTLADTQVLDVGCGDGRFLRLLNHWGANPINLHGCDINKERISIAKELHPQIQWSLTDGATLPYNDKEFGIVCQSTVFTSILSLEMKKRLAAEMMRVCKSNGLIAWFDFRYDNPWNKAVRGVSQRELRELFPGCQFDLSSVGLLPPLARSIVHRSPLLAGLLETIPPLRYAYLGIIKPLSTGA